MTQTETLRLECLNLASSHLSCEPHNIETLIQWAQKFYDFVTEQPTQATSDPQAPYEVSYVAEKPTGAVIREWLYDKLVKMLEVAKESRRRALISGNLTSHASCDGQCDAFKAVINLINPKEQ